MSMNQLIVAHWAELSAKIQRKKPDHVLSGHNLDLATVIAIARYIGVPGSRYLVYLTHDIDMAHRQHLEMMPLMQ